MILIPLNFLGFSHAQVWFPCEASEIEDALRSFTLVSLMQADKTLTERFSRHAFRVKPFYTTIVDLSRDEAVLWSRLDKKSTRYAIRKAEKEGFEIYINMYLENAYQLINKLIMARRYRRQLSHKEWLAILNWSDVWCGLYNGETYVVHVLLRDGQSRVRLLMSATKERTYPEVKSRVGSLNRFMHWNEILHYRRCGVRLYDFGGIELDRKADTHTITQFKLSFGGDIVTEYIVRMTSMNMLRFLLKSAYLARDLSHQLARKTRDKLQTTRLNDGH